MPSTRSPTSSVDCSRLLARQGVGDTLAPNEVICPVCKVVIRATRELRPGDKVYCMPCMSRMVVVVGENGRLEADVIF